MDLRLAVGGVAVHDDARVQQLPAGLVLRDPGRDDRTLGGVGPRQVALDPGAAEERGREPEPEGRGTARDVGAPVADVTAQVLGRHEDAGPPLDALPVERVVRVGHPDAAGAPQHAEVDTAAA